MGRLDSLLPRFEPPRELRPLASLPNEPAAVCVRWFGTAGFLLEFASGNVLIDPYFTRASLRRLPFPLEPDAEAIARRLPTKLDAVVCGHSHFDHLLDAPLAARSTGATFIGSHTSAAFARASHVANERIIAFDTKGGHIELAGLSVELLPSLHARIAFGRVPLPGEVLNPPRLPAPAWKYRVGGAFGVLVRGSGVSVYHNGSADLIDTALEGVHADVLLVGLAGRKVTPRYLERLLLALKPRVVIPAHHDAFFAPLEASMRLLPGVDFAGFVREVNALAPQASVIAPRYDEVVWIGEHAERTCILR